MIWKRISAYSRHFDRYLSEPVWWFALPTRLSSANSEKSQTNASEMIPDKPPKEDVFHGSEDLKKEAHISSFEKYKELYLKSIENPDGTCSFIESQSINQSSVRWRSFSEEVHLPHVTSRHHLAVKYCVRNHAFRFEQQYKQNITQLQKHLEQTQHTFQSHWAMTRICVSHPHSAFLTNQYNVIHVQSQLNNSDG